ncbi:SDR family oxidoreductase [Pigmentiphaga aceris]|uniref:SDR family oxidoreductase n=1 Tax=Pigmentiphaga aceris TaxID=1940612 RepID=UPI00319DD431
MVCRICRASRAGRTPKCRRYSRLKIAPGTIATDVGGGAVRDNNDVNAYVAQDIALGRVGQPDDIGAAVAAILSDDMAWANGTTFDISGGQLL